MKTDTLITKPETPAGLSSSVLLASVKCKICNVPLVRAVEQVLCVHCEGRLEDAVKKAPWLSGANGQYILTFLKNSGEETRAIRLVCDAAECNTKTASFIIREAWREWRRNHPLVAG